MKMENLISKFNQQEVTAKTCGYLDYAFVKLSDFFKFNNYAHMCSLAMFIGCCDDVFNF